MRLSKRQLKRIIREEYSRLKRRGLINESIDDYQKELIDQALEDNLTVPEEFYKWLKTADRPKRGPQFFQKYTIKHAEGEEWVIDWEMLKDQLVEDEIDLNAALEYMMKNYL